MKEKAFENKIKAYLEQQGAWHVKYIANGYTRSGIPDLICCVNGKFLAIEVKAEHGRVSELQKYQIEQIKKSGGQALIVYPKDFEEFKKIVEELKNEN